MNARKAEQLTTVVVIAGAGARGAYEAAAMAEVLPRICPEPDGLANTILLGTSAGAINAALWASRARPGKPLVEIGEEVKAVWKQIHRDSVYTLPVLGYAGIGTVAALDTVQTVGDVAVDTAADIARAVAGFIPKLPLLPSARDVVDHTRRLARDATSFAFGVGAAPVAHPLGATGALLDTAPLWDTARKHLDVQALHANVADGGVAGVGVVATSCPRDASGGRSRVFLRMHDAARLAIPHDPTGAIDYVPTPRLEIEHVLASAAIPLVFPPVLIREPAAYAGWYTDGGVRLNAPIEPAIKLSGDRRLRIVVISSHATTYPRVDAADPDAPRPEVLDIGAQAIHVTLADGMIEDLRALRRLNKLIADAGPGVLTTVRGRPYRQVEVIEVAPASGSLSQAASDVAAKVLNAADAGLLRFFSRFGGSSGRNELLSYLLFEPEYYDLQFKAGTADARAQLV